MISATREAGKTPFDCRFKAVKSGAGVPDGVLPPVAAAPWQAAQWSANSFAPESGWFGLHASAESAEADAALNAETANRTISDALFGDMEPS